ncbi:hypothetical protein IL306_013546 [Fusarium sp. DS 682]|nr:hypothetical protein IL306_013546 [Fusarium sp. DS 682]
MGAHRRRQKIKESDAKESRKAPVARPVSTSDQLPSLLNATNRIRLQPRRLYLDRYGIPIFTTMQTSTPGKRGTKRPVDALDRDLDSPQKRPRRSARLSLVENTSDRPATNNGSIYEPANLIEFWAREGQWPQEYFELDIEHLLARKRSLSALARKRSNSATSTTPSDQKPREEKSASYRDPRYETLLGTKGSFMVKSNLDITSASKDLYYSLILK